MLTEHPLHLVEEILDQGLGILEGVGPTRVMLGPMPVVARRRPCPESGAAGGRTMRVVEADQPRTVRRVQGK
jgi:hypothetical protein